MRAFILLGLLFLCNHLIATEDFFDLELSKQPESSLDIEALIENTKANIFKDLEKALHFASLAKARANSNGQVEKLFQINQLIGRCFENNNHLDSAQVYYQKALQNAILLKDEKNKVKALSDLAVIARRLTKYYESRDYRFQVLEIANQLNDLEALAVTYHGLGTLLKEVGDYDKSAAYFLKSIEYSEQLGKKGQVVNTMQFLAMTYSEANLSEFALTTIQKANEMVLEVNDTILMGIVTFDFGKILGKMNDHESALEKFKEAHFYFEGIQHKPLIARTLLYIGDNYAQQEKYELAQDYFQRCLKLEPYISIKGQADLNYKTGDLFFLQNDFKQAKSYFDKSLLIAENHKLKDFCKKSHYKLYEIYMAEKKVDKAISHLEGYTKLKEDLLEESKAKKITELQFKYETTKSEHEIQELQIQQNELTQKAGTAIFSIILLFMFYSTWTYKNNNQTLRAKNEEIQTKNVKLKESNEVLQQFTYVAGHDLKEPLRNIGSFVSLIDRRYGEQLPGESKEYMQCVLKGVHRMNGLLSSLLEYSTISIQKTSEKMINSQQIIHDVIFSMSDTIQRKEAVIECIGEMPNIRMNDLHLTQLFQNLIGNSLKFSDHNPKVSITGKVNEKELFFMVQDNGIGIDSAHGDKIFKLFYKPDKSPTANGTGIGLTICKNIIDKYNGRIWFEQNEERGTTFHFSLPKELAA
jgi:signal transduction histidine kinase